jgi:predicted glutamine amidotransferase
MAYVSKSDTNFPTVAGKDFDEFEKLSAIHKDGWGIVTKNGAVIKDFHAAVDTPSFHQTLLDNNATASLLHFRWATSGLSVKTENAHPFVLGEYSFIHNGAVNPPDVLDKFISPQYLEKATGTTDSEKYFLLVVQEVEKLGLIDGIKEALKIIKGNADYSSINAMLLTPEKLIVVNEHENSKRPSDQPEDYYELKFKEGSEGVVVASSGWNQDGWKDVPNHSLMVIDRKSQSYSFETL